MSEENKNEEGLVEIPEEVVVEEESFDTEGLLPEEVKMAEEHGLVKEEDDGEHKEQSDTETEDSSEEVEDEKPDFEDVEKDESLKEKYNANEKALYFKWKNDKHKRQEATKKYEELVANNELATLKDRVSDSKLKKISEALNSDNVTVEQLQAIIDNQQKAEENDDTPITRAELARIEKEKQDKLDNARKMHEARQSRLLVIEELGKTKHSNFDDIVNLAQEMVESDKAGTYSDILDRAISSDDVEVEDVLGKIVDIARLNPKYKDIGKKVDEKDVGKVEKAIKNSKKKVSSASLSNANGKRKVAEEDMTEDDAARLSAEQWMKLKPSTRKRLLGG